MSGHKHAELMLEYAKDAAKTDKPWELWEGKHDYGDWETLGSNPSWSKSFEYRRKPVKWSPVGGDWFINQCDDAVEKWNMSTEETKQAGLERPTQQQADRAFIEMRKFNRLLALRDELCGDELCGEGIAKYFIFFNTKHKQWDFTDFFVSEYVAPCFTTDASAERACDMLNSGEVIL